MLLIKRLKCAQKLRFYSGIEKLKGVGFNENEAKEIELAIDFELVKLTEEYATLERLKKLQITLDDKMSNASSFVTSTSPFQMSFSSNNTSNPNSSIIPLMNPVLDPLVLEKEIKTTGQQLNDEIKQLQADYQLDANLEVKRREDVDLVLEAKLEASSEYAAEKVKYLNEHLDRVSRQALTAIGGNQAQKTRNMFSFNI
jgi:citrate lyase gamma subunit